MILVSFSPTMTAAVITDTGARGRLSETVLAFVVLADLVALVAFSLLMQTARAIFQGTTGDPDEILLRFALAGRWCCGVRRARGCPVRAVYALCRP